jgi:hypothetical protein
MNTYIYHYPKRDESVSSLLHFSRHDVPTCLQVLTPRQLLPSTYQMQKQNGVSSLVNLPVR